MLNRLVSHLGGHTREDEAIVNLPNWLPFSFRIQGEPWFGIEPGSLTAHDHWLLDLELGVLEREVHLIDQKGRRTRFGERRLVSMADPHLVAQQVTINSENWSGHLGVLVGIDTDVRNTNVPEYGALASRHLELLEAGRSGNTLWVLSQTTRSQVRIAQAMRLFAMKRGGR